VARTIRTCSLALLLASLGPLHAEARRSDASELELYARARTGVGPAAVHAYADALTAAPDQTTVALHAYRQAVIGGDYALALRAAQSLERLGRVPSDARLLFYIAALRDRDWKAASIRLKDVAREPDFAFMVPILADWLTLAAGDLPGVFTTSALTAKDAYAQESHALLLLAKGDVDGGSTIIKTLWSLDPYRAQSLRLTAAATLANRGHRDAATALLLASDNTTVSARQQIAKHHKLRIGIDSPSAGAAFLLSRMAGDLIVQGSPRAAITLSRFAQFADPENPRIALIAAGAFAIAKDSDKQTALALADRLRKDPLYGEDATSLRIDLLERTGNVDQAIAEARQRATASSNDLSRVGDMEARRGNYREAVAIFRTILSGTDKPSAALLYATGNALDRAGDWPAARPYLERALTLTPGNPVLLNELGYGLVEHDKDPERALQFLNAAAQMKPDSAAIMDSLGWANYRLGNNDLAIAGLERAVTLDNAEPEISEHLGDAYWRGGRRIAARYSWAAARIQADGERATRLDGKIERGLP
jgi:tetratricopeptide (TPR) repeat protein